MASLRYRQFLRPPSSGAAWPLPFHRRPRALTGQRKTNRRDAAALARIGKVLKAKPRKVPSRVARTLRLAAQCVACSDNKIGEFCRRLKARLGKAESTASPPP